MFNYSYCNSKLPYSFSLVFKTALIYFRLGDGAPYNDSV
uniref:Uncharacterized protein n=1 Tax=Arundo donax TaxID=35708 RepID=A0A0A9G1G5_ARUDO